MRLPLLILLTAATLATPACHKADTRPAINFGAGDGISHRDASGMKNGSQDPTDWSADDYWNDSETALFPSLSSGSLAIDLQDSPLLSSFDHAYTYAYPNPAKQATWQLQSISGGVIPAPTYSVQAVLVDRHYQVVTTWGPSRFSGRYAVLLDYAKLEMQAGELYRLYYVVYDGKTFMYKGHGDISYAP